MIVALIGCHGAGKTTLGRALSSRLGWVFHDEIGARLAADGRFRAPGTMPDEEQDLFDEAVAREELARDASFDRRAHRLVETWHVGNLAYAAARSPAVARRYRTEIESVLARLPAAVIEVTAPERVLRQRKYEPGPESFFLKVAASAFELARELGLPAIAHVTTENETADEIACRLLPRVLAAASEGDRI